MTLDDIDRELENYEKRLIEERKKMARMNLILLAVLIIVIISFIYALWRYQALN